MCFCLKLIGAVKAADSNSPASAAEQVLFTSSSQEIQDEPGPLVHEQSSVIASRPESCLNMRVTIPAMEQCLLPSEESNHWVYRWLSYFIYFYYNYTYFIN